MGLFDGLRAALRKNSASNAGRAQRVVDQMESGETPQPTGLRQTQRVSAGDLDDMKGKGKPKKRATMPEDLE